MSATGIVLVVMLSALALFGIGCTILGLLAQLRPHWTKHYGIGRTILGLLAQLRPRWTKR